QSRSYVEILRPRQHLLQRDIGDGVFNDDALRQPGPWTAVELDGAEFAFGEFITPIAERAFGKLHDVALVDNGDVLAPVLQGVLERGADQPLSAGPADGLDAEADLVGRLLAEADFLETCRQLALEEVED